MLSSPTPLQQTAGALLSISKLTFAYSNSSTPVLQDLSLEAGRGEILAVIGVSGCGKSTLLHLIAGLLQPHSGEIRLTDGRELTRIGYIFQQDALLPWRTVGANLALASELTGRAERLLKEDLREFLNSFHLDEQILAHYPAQLSGGMRQRVSIIQTLLFNPKLLLLDEPFSALDFCTKLSLESEFYNFVKLKSKTALLVTHDIEEAIALADRIILLNKKGRIEAQIPIAFGSSTRDPESVRGLPLFAEYYRTIWEQLKGVMAA